MRNHRIIFEVVTLVGLFLPMFSGCDWVREAAGLTLEMERRYPGSRIETRDLYEGGSHKVEVTIKGASFRDETNIAEEARGVAESVTRRYELRADSDSVSVAFLTEQGTGAARSSSGAFFVFSVAELTAGD